MLYVKQRRVLAASLLVGSMLGLATSASRAADPEPREIASYTLGWKTSPNSSRVVYVRGSDVAMPSYLMSAAISGGPHLTLNEQTALSVAPDSQSMQISPDNGFVVYARDLLGQYDNQLYSVPLLDGTPMPLVGAAHGDVQWFQITGDSRRVIYATSTRLDNTRTVKAVYSVPIDGSSPATLLTPTLTMDQRIAQVAVAPDGSRVVFLVATGVWDAERSTLYSVPSGGGAAVALDGGLRSGGFNQLFRIAPSSGRVAYLRLVEGAADTELYQAPIAGGATGALDTPETGGFQSFDWSPDSRYLVFTAVSVAGTSSDIYSVAVAPGATAVPLGPPSQPGGYIESFKITPDGARVLYDGPDTLARWALFSAPIGGGARTKLSGKLAPRTSYGDDILPQVLVSGTSGYAVYFADQLDDDNPTEQMYGVPVDGSAPARRLGSFQAIPGWNFAEQTELTPDGRQVVFPQWHATYDQPFDLWTVPVGGGAETLLSGTVGLLNGGSSTTVDRFSLTADSRHALFRSPSSALYVADLPAVELPGRNVYLPSVTRR